MLGGRGEHSFLCVWEGGRGVLVFLSLWGGGLNSVMILFMEFCSFPVMSAEMHAELLTVEMFMWVILRRL